MIIILSFSSSLLSLLLSMFLEMSLPWGPQLEGVLVFIISVMLKLSG